MAETVDDDQLRADQVDRPAQALRVVDAARVGQDDVEPQLRRVLHEAVDVVLGAVPLRLAGVDLEVEVEQPAGLRRDDRVAEAGDEDVRHDRREPRSRAEEHPVGARGSARQGLVGAARVRRQQAYALHPSPGRRHPVLPTDDGDGLGVCLVVADDLGLDVERDAGHRQDPAAGVEQPADEVEAVDGVAEQVPEGHDEEVAEGVAGQRPLALEPVLEHVAPGVAPLGVVAERGERHPQVARAAGPRTPRAAVPTTRRRRRR